MKVHTTNYENAFIAVADDCPVAQAEIPPLKGDKKTVANLQYEILSKHPYEFTSDDVLFQVFAERHDLTKAEWKKARDVFFSKGQPCFCTSPLTKRYGWGVHHDANGKIALVPSGSPQYDKFLKDKSLQVLKAMRSSR